MSSISSVSNTPIQPPLLNPDTLAEGMREIIHSHASRNVDEYSSALNLNACDNDQLIQAFFEINNCLDDASYQHISPQLNAIAFEVKDLIIRKATQDNNAEEIRNLAALHNLPQLEREIARLLPNRTVFKNLTDLFQNAIPDNPPQAAERNEALPPRILHASFEYTKAKVGGVGSVVESLSANQKQKNINAKVLTPFYEFYQTDPAYRQAEFVGFVDHEYRAKGKENEPATVRSAVYKIKTQNGQVTQYLLKADPRHKNIFSIGCQKDIYEDTPKTKHWDRNFYFTSATSAVASMYQGKTQDKAFDILHIHTWSIGLAGRLVKENYNPARERQGFSSIGVVQHFHSNNFFDQGMHAGKDYARVGLTPPSQQYAATQPDDSYGQMNIQRDSWLFGADAVVHVSPYFANLSQRPTTHMSEISRNLAERKALYGVLNGISHQKYDTTSPETYREFAVNPVDASTSTPFIDSKERSKQVLHQAGIIADPTKPLYTFVGRYSSEKGINILPSMVEEIIRENGQVVIMGTKVGNFTPPALKDLLKLQKKHPHAVRVYIDIKDQTENLGVTGVAKGALIRKATDFSLIPSHQESCGLVGLEALAVGALPISSKVQGLGDFLIDSDASRFNSFTYLNGPTPGESKRFSHIKNFFWNILRKRNAKKAIRAAADYYRRTDRPEMEQTIRRVWESSQAYDWNAEEGSVNQLSRIYKHVIDKETIPLSQANLRRLVKKTSKLQHLFNLFKYFVSYQIVEPLIEKARTKLHTR